MKNKNNRNNIKYGWIYRIFHILTQKSYIGRTVDLEKRLQKHFQKSSNIPLRNAIKRYGKEAFSYEILYSNIPEWMLRDLEERTIAALNTFHGFGYNCTPGGIDSNHSGINSYGFKNEVSKNLDNIIKLNQEGISFDEIGKMYNVSGCTIKNHLKRNGIDFISNRVRHDIQANKEEIVEAYNNGESVQSLSKKYNCSDDPIKKILRESGIRKRTRKEARKTSKENASQSI